MFKGVDLGSVSLLMFWYRTGKAYGGMGQKKESPKKRRRGLCLRCALGGLWAGRV